MIETILTALLAFISSNIDDVFILMTLFTQVPKSLTRKSIIAGQYIGIITLVVFSVVCSLIGIIIPTAYIGLLGLLPIYLGGKKIYEHLKNNDEVEDVSLTRNNSGKFINTLIGVQTLNVSAITIANGGDNIGIYVPLFVNRTAQELILTVIIFLPLVYVLLLISEYATKHPLVSHSLKKYSHIIFPLVLIGLGIYIMIDSETYKLLD